MIKDREEHLKFQVADFPMYPRLAVLDPESTRTLPPRHRRRDRHGRDDPRDRGLRVLASGTRTRDAYALAGAAADPRQPRARGGRHRRTTTRAATCWSPRTWRSSPRRRGAIGIAHSLSHPCGAHYDVPARRGQRDQPPLGDRVQRRGRRADIADRYRDINELLGLESRRRRTPRSAHALAEHVRGVGRGASACPRGCREVGVPEEGIPQLVEGARATGARSSTRASPPRRSSRSCTRRRCSPSLAAGGSS